MLTEAVRRTHPAVIEELTPAQLTLGEVQSVLQALLQEEVSIRDLVRIFEALSMRARVGHDLDGLVEAARAALGPAVIAPYVAEGTLNVVSFEPGLEQRLLEALRPAETGGFLVVDPDLAQRMLGQLAGLVRRAEEQNVNPVLACAPQLRSAVRRTVAATLPRLPVISYSELSGPTQIRSVGVVDGVAVAA
jgi:flagellar biosynthesis protein FlhA